VASAAARPRVIAGLRLLQLVGEGGEGEVWEARDTTGRRRALKLIRPDALVPPAEVERRGRWLLDIEHPALVTVHRCGVLAGAGLDGWGFVEMDYVDGTPLSLAPADPDALERLEPLAEALDLLHAGMWSDGVPLVHRDVKPANLIEDDDGELVLVDASTLREVDDGTRTRIGTPLFAAPEVVTGRAGPLADVYSFAATAVALLTGARQRELAALLDDPAELDLPEGVRAALADDPADRPVSCRAALNPELPLIVGREVGWRTPVGDATAAQDVRGGRPTAHEPLRDAAGWLPPAGDAEDWDDGAGDWFPSSVEALAEDGSRDHDDEEWFPPVPVPPGAAPPAGPDRLPSATEVLLTPWVDPYAAVRADAGAAGWAGASAAAGWAGVTAWPWALGFLLLALLTAAGGLLDLPEVTPVLGVVAVVHVVLCLLARQRVLTTVLVPPLAWAALLSERAARPGPPRAWTRTTLLSGTGALLALALAVTLVPQVVDTATGIALGITGAVVLLASVRAGTGSRTLRLVLAPAWVLGAGVLLLACVVLLLPALLLRRVRSVGELLRQTAASAVAFVRS
jgi:hypothetical protein